MAVSRHLTALVMLVVLVAAAASCSSDAGSGQMGEARPSQADTGVPDLTGGPDSTTASPALDLQPVTDAMPSESCLMVTGSGDPTAVRAERALKPASAMKLVTAHVALQVLDLSQPTLRQTVEAAIERALGESDNDAARTLTEMIGAQTSGEATVDAGTAAFESVLAQGGIPTEGFRAVDGWGLSHDNRASCATLHSVVSAHGSGSVLGRALAVAGASGTAAERFPEASGRLRVKTGWIREAVALAGFLAWDGGEVQFTLLAEGLPNDDGAALQDLLVATLARQLPG